MEVVLVKELTEEWAIIPSHRHYAISSFGQVRNLKTGNLLKWQSSKRGTGSVFVDLIKDKKHTSVMLHILVARCFIGERPPCTKLVHRSGDVKNPRVDNLQYFYTDGYGRTEKKRYVPESSKVVHVRSYGQRSDDPKNLSCIRSRNKRSDDNTTYPPDVMDGTSQPGKLM